MTGDRGLAPAKVNLALHVTGQRADGYHLLDSLVVFAGLGDLVTAQPARDVTLKVMGPFAPGVPVDEDNSVLRAARALRAARNVVAGAAITLTKRLPHAAGLGSGSADAAAALRVLCDLWRTPLPAPDDPMVLALGADVPACLAGPGPLRMRGIGEELSPAPPVPGCAMVLVNPRVEVPTPAVFRGLAHKTNPPLAPDPAWRSRAEFLDWLALQRNDLRPPAAALTPEVARALALLDRTPGIVHAVMSGSGATCVGLTTDMGTAQRAARTIQVSEMGWWVAPAPILGPAQGQATRATT
ncbi:MAG: 4-(cytidine 5'-diphospho)-2-C-methyl-D-erythritol kinase [Rubellimicrobium sp.]|nr:4-(cytidine 5'-diphospho)-2-C-methyl-D-erythritol kinase [Rubellimicrobium sp.]